MSDFCVTTQWLNGDLDTPDESASYAEVSISVAAVKLTQLFDYDEGLLADGPRLPTSVLVGRLIGGWWSLLYEPKKIEDDRGFEARHRLDSLTPGYVFPPVALWSSGDTMTAAVLEPDTRFQRQVFLLPEKRGPWIIARSQVEKSLGQLVAATLDRMVSRDVDTTELRDTWARIQSSSQDADERLWCINAGRLGIDPYDPATPDLTRISDGVSDAVFGDICEATELSELARTCQWARSTSERLRNAPTIQIKQFGAPHRRDLFHPGWRDGYDSARLLRSRTSLPQEPRRAMDELLGDTVQDARGRLADGAPVSMEGLTRRTGNEMRVVTNARSIRQRRFRMCRAAYLAWRSQNNGEAAITTGVTWRQQASRAFAAELLAPAELLRDRAGRAGLTQDVVERLATEWVCPPLAIIHQAQNHGIPLRGVQVVARDQ